MPARYILLTLLLTTYLLAEDTFLIRLGVSDTAATNWNGTATVRNGRLTDLRGWQFDGADAISADGRSWQATTALDEYWHAPWERSLFGTKRQTKISERGLILTVEMNGAGAVQLATPAGSIEFEPSSIAWNSPRTFAGGTVIVERTPAPARISAPGAQDYVTALLTGDNTEWTAWQTYRDGGDQLWVRRGAASPEPLTEAGADLFRVQLAEGNNDAVWAIWSEQKDSNFDLFARTWQNGSWSSAERVTTAPGSDIHHALASAAGRLYLTWQSARNGNTDIFLKTHDGSRWSDDLLISDSPANDWEPAVAVSPSGKVAIAWDSYAGGDYDIFLRFLANGELSDPVAIADTPCFEARPQALYDRAGRLWLAWEEGDPQWGKDYVNQIRNAGMGLLMRRQIRVGVHDGTRLRQPAGNLSDVLPEEFQSIFVSPSLRLDSAGRPWLFFRYRTNTPVRPKPSFRSMWRLGATAYIDDKWTPLIRLAKGYGRIDAPTAAHLDTDGNLKVHWVSDGREFPGGFPGEQDLYAATVNTGRSTRSELALENFKYPAADFPPVHPNEAADVARLRAYRARSDDDTYRIVRGDMHRHTDISWDGNRDGSLFDAYRYALDAASHDYLGVADHNAGEDIEYSWWMTQKSVDLLSIAGRFAPLYGYERSRSYPSGHRNVMHAERGVPVFGFTAAERADNANTSVDHLYEHLRKTRGIVMSHTSGTGAGTDWRDSDAEVETLMEVYQGYRTSYEHEGAPRSTTGGRPAGFVWKAWEKGVKLGLQSSSDHVSTHSSHAMIFVDELTRESILDGIRARRAYAATDNILLDFRVNGVLMGSEISASGRPKLTVKVTGTAPIDKVEVIRNNEYVHTHSGDDAELDFTFVDSAAPAGESYYYVRVEQANGELAWSSPVWVTLE
jgi:hypothetical protein